VLDSSNWITDDRELNIILQKHHVETVFYVGFATDICILDRPYGIKKMHDLGYQIILLRDCTSGFEYDDTLGKMWVTEIAVREVEAMPHGYSCTANDFMKGLKPQ